MTGYVGDPASYPADVRLVDDGQPASAAFLGLADQDLADRTANINARLLAQGVGDGSALVKAVSYQILNEQIIVATGRAGAITFTLPFGATNAPIGRAVLIVEGSNDATAINIAPHAGDTIYNARTSITHGKDAVLAKKISATVWVLFYLSDYDVHDLDLRVTFTEGDITSIQTALGVLAVDNLFPGSPYAGGGPYILTYAGNNERVAIVNTATAIHVKLPVAPQAGYSVRVLTTVTVTTIEVRTSADALIVNNASNVSVMGPEESRLFTWNGAVWIRG